MKKLIAISAILALSASALCACSPKPNPKDREAPPQTRLVESGTPSGVPQGRSIENTPSGRSSDGATKPSFPGVRRRLAIGIMPESGSYSMEYVHFPISEDRDESLDYSLELRDDNTFTFNVVTNKISATHEGHWYGKHGGNIVLFYDEPIDETAHNVYVSDCMYCEYLPNGKIMIYDNCNIIVLSREDITQDDLPQNEPGLYQAKQ